MFEDSVELLDSPQLSHGGRRQSHVSGINLRTSVLGQDQVIIRWLYILGVRGFDAQFQT